ncbi:TPA: hypothetical protein ACIPVM_004541 [Salmonella enterica subsp. diarizonae serovar 50:k:z35]
MGQKRTKESQTDKWAGTPDVCVMSDAVAEALAGGAGPVPS